MAISYNGSYRKAAPFRLVCIDPNDETRLIVHNEKNGMVDDGELSNDPPEHCYNCDTQNSLLSSVSLHFCKCGVIFNYWAGGGNEKWDNHYKKMNAAREAQAAMDWYEADDFR